MLGTERDSQEKAIDGSDLGVKIAEILLKTGCVELIEKSKPPFKYSSGLFGPIYTDNRQLISLVKEREIVVDAFIFQARNFEFDAYLGVATSGIPFASFVSQKSQTPNLYCRSEAKVHGKGKTIEGNLKGIKSVIVIEDLINQGSSIAKVIENIENSSLEIKGILSIVNYETPAFYKNFNNKSYSIQGLTNFKTLAQVALDMGHIDQEQWEYIQDWNSNPELWSEKSQR